MSQTGNFNMCMYMWTGFPCVVLITFFMLLVSGQHDAWMDEWMDGWMDGHMDGHMDGWMDGWIDG